MALRLLMPQNNQVKWGTDRPLVPSEPGRIGKENLAGTPKTSGDTSSILLLSPQLSSFSRSSVYTSLIESKVRSTVLNLVSDICLTVFVYWFIIPVCLTYLTSVLAANKVNVISRSSSQSSARLSTVL